MNTKTANMNIKTGLYMFNQKMHFFDYENTWTKSNNNFYGYRVVKRKTFKSFMKLSQFGYWKDFIANKINLISV